MEVKKRSAHPLLYCLQWALTVCSSGPSVILCGVWTTIRLTSRGKAQRASFMRHTSLLCMTVKWGANMNKGKNSRRSWYHTTWTCSLLIRNPSACAFTLPAALCGALMLTCCSLSGLMIRGKRGSNRASMKSQQLTVLGPCAVVCMRDAKRRHTACHEYDVKTGTCGSRRCEYTTAVDTSTGTACLGGRCSCSRRPPYPPISVIGAYLRFYIMCTIYV